MGAARWPASAREDWGAALGSGRGRGHLAGHLSQRCSGRTTYDKRRRQVLDCAAHSFTQRETMKPIPRLLQTYEEARLLFESKGWGLAKATDYLSELPELKGIKLSQASFSRKTTQGCSVPIEPEVAAA